MLHVNQPIYRCVSFLAWLVISALVQTKVAGNRLDACEFPDSNCFEPDAQDASTMLQSKATVQVEVEKASTKAFEGLSSASAQMMHEIVAFVEGKHMKHGTLAPKTGVQGRWKILPLMIFMAAALMLNFIKVDKYGLIVLVALWGVSTIVMNIVNKLAVQVIPLPMTLIIMQMLLADVLLCIFFGPIRLWNEICSNSTVAIRWGLLTIFFSSGLVTSILALQDGSVILILTVRNVMPLLTLIVERLLLPQDSTREVTSESFFGLLMLAVGTTIYSAADLGESHSYKALGYIFLNMFCMIVYRLAERRMLIDMPQSLSFGALNLLQNFCGLALVVVLFFAWGEFKGTHTATLRETLLFVWHDPLNLAVVFFSGVAGLALGYYSTKLQKEVTATTFLALQSATKVMTILFAVIVLNEHPTALGIGGCMVSLAGGTWYGFAARREQPRDKPEVTPDEPEATTEQAPETK